MQQNRLSILRLVKFGAAVSVWVTLLFAYYEWSKGNIPKASFIFFMAIVSVVLYYYLKYYSGTKLTVVLRILFAFYGTTAVFLNLLTEFNNTLQMAWYVSYPVFVFLGAGFRVGIGWLIFTYFTLPMFYYYHLLAGHNPYVPLEFVLHTGFANIMVALISGYFAYKTESVQAKLENQASVDFLTQSYNRRYMNHLLEDMSVSKRQRDQVFSIILFDIDHFKSINDQYGHEGGDIVLVNLAQQTKRFIRHDDYLGRWGGEEFVIVLPDTGIDNAILLAEKIRTAFSSTHIEVPGKEPFLISASFGVVEYDHQFVLRELINRVDSMLYLSKEQGRNRVNGCRGAVNAEACTPCIENKIALCTPGSAMLSI